MNSAILRLLDANLNRAREGLRVLEDYARFILDDQAMCAEAKAIRHVLGAATAPIAAEALQHRDTPNDVGTENKVAGELHRADLRGVVTASGKRVGEALRAIEEYLKVLRPEAALDVERARYRLYDLELRVARTLRPRERFAGVRLYVLITESVCRRPWLETAELALRGGADVLQLREKSLDGGELLPRARALVSLCRRYGALSIINDRADVAALSGADGVHVGQGDLPAIEVRKIVGNSSLVGVSTHDVSQARRAMSEGADYIGVGPCFASSTKSRGYVAGCDWLREVSATVPLPAVAIAGITDANVDEVLATGVFRIAVTGAVAGADDPMRAAAVLKERLLKNSNSAAVARAVSTETK